MGIKKTYFQDKNADTTDVKRKVPINGPTRLASVFANDAICHRTTACVSM